MKFAFLIEPPFNFRDSAGNVTGCDVELARYVFSAIGCHSFEPVETEFAELLPGVSEGRWRMTTGLFGTEERRQIASFSRPIWALPDGLLVKKGNPFGLTGYQSVAANEDCAIAVIRDQFQHRSASSFGVPDTRILVFETYVDAARAVAEGRAAAYASVGRAHTGFIDLNQHLDLEVVLVPSSEKQSAFGSFAFSKSDDAFRDSVDHVLNLYVGSDDHRAMMKRYGFTMNEIDLLVAYSDLR